MDYDIQFHIKRERNKAKNLRKSAWWQCKLAAAKCYYCLQDVDAKTATMDHIVPLSRGGRTTKGNIAISCRICNQNKYDAVAAELFML